MKTSLRFVLLPVGVTAVLVWIPTQHFHWAWPQALTLWVLLSLIFSSIILFLVRLNVVIPLKFLTSWIQKMHLGIYEKPSFKLPRDIFGPLETEISELVLNLASARATAEEEARLRQAGAAKWTAHRLREFAQQKLEGKPLFVVSNREPYLHQRKGKAVQWIVPPSGLVTALEPILRSCGGTWIAQGSGDADQETSDADGRLQVPPDNPRYTLRRVWLSKAEEDGYYYGFSNEGLWPLCHIAHTLPIFRSEDWQHYCDVNKKFAEVALQEMASTQEPLVLVQDYHFALLPQLIKAERPDARVALFWHIPWPNPESFGICPWQKELLQGMLGADLIGFHIQFHCNNFLETVDRVLESRIDREHFSVNRSGQTTWVKPLPISVAWPASSSATMEPPGSFPNKTDLLKEVGVQARFLAVGVDRIDYTKGLLERFHAIERFLEKYPQFQSEFTFVELGAPSRSLIKRYNDLVTEVEAEIQRINNKFQTDGWKPIVFLKKQHSRKEIEPFYKAADVCMVTSLHDGMNLVAKEFVAAREDNDGVLILSHFTGASRELDAAVTINPYNIEQMADALRYSLEMELEERSARMLKMREVVQTNNIYRWGASLIAELSRVPVLKEKALTLR